MTSASTPRLARRRTRSPRPARTGDFRRIAGHGLPRRAIEWLSARARRSADLYDGYRVDHLVGFFRTYAREQDGTAGFVPADEHEQIAQGEQLLTLFAASGARVIAEDLGLIPDFVRLSTERLGIPGFKVIRWERDWQQEGHPFTRSSRLSGLVGGDQQHARYRNPRRMVGYGAG